MKLSLACLYMKSTVRPDERGGERKAYATAVLATLCVSLLATAPAGAVSAPARDYRPLASGSLIQDKDFYILTLIEGLPQVRSAVAADPALQAMARDRRARLEAARNACNGEVDCLIQPYLWTDPEIAEAERRLTDGLAASGLAAQLASEMRRSGRFARYQDLDDLALIRQAWGDASMGMNHVLRVWALGEPPLYPLIDSISYPRGDKMWKDAVDDLVDVDLEPRPSDELFFQLPLSAALDVLYMNDRDEPARLEPLSQGENAAALAYAKTLDWSRWRYPVMLIPGRSPTLANNPLSPEAKMKLRLAAERFHQGVAPLIVVSGGYVSPSQTRFCEALEMKRELMRTYHIPERAILVDPFARHTTTNLRNTERLMLEAGAPTQRPILVTTTAYQSSYIEGQVFHDRCLRELGYLCLADLRRLSIFDTVLTLPTVSAHRDARDPLDP